MFVPGRRISSLLTSSTGIPSPSTAPIPTAQFINSTFRDALTPTGGISAGLASGTFNYLWRVRFVTPWGYGPPGPASDLAHAGSPVNAGSHYVRLSLPTSNNADVIGLLLERNSQATPGGWFPILENPTDPYTLDIGAPYFDDHIPDALLQPALSLNDASSGPIRLDFSGLMAPDSGFVGDSSVQAVPKYPSRWLKYTATYPDGTAETYGIPAFLLES